MAIYTTLNELFTGIANAIRTKNNTTELIMASNFPAEIASLRTGFDYNNQNTTAISDYEFYNCIDLKSVDCYNLTTIGTSAFENCTNLKSVILYDGVESVEENAFKGCNNLTIYCEAAEKPETWHENWNPDNCEVVWEFNLVETWDVSATEEDNVTAKLYNDALNEGMYSLVVSGNGDMKDCALYSDVPWVDCRKNINSVTISKGITSIGDFAFCVTKLTSITIPNTVTSIGDNAFSSCTDLTSINIPNGVTNIGNKTFQDCTSLTSINIPKSVTSIGGWVFEGCSSLTSINYSGTVAQWKVIIFDDNWNYVTPNYTIHCTDGDIAKDGTILGGAQ